ncbi:MAG: thioesterase domain-containing protein, partial [Chloroflexota bacterium]
RLYKTGDLARYLPDGDIEYLGRIDNQLQLRGFRIELGEIEENLMQHPTTREVLILGRKDSSGDPYLAAYLISHEQELPSISEWRSFLAQKLPEYMIPSAFVSLDQFPLTINGKIDRSALPNPETTRSDLLNQWVPARSPQEAEMVLLWQDVLGVTKIGIHDNFFDLGGHSMLAVRLLARIEAEMDKKVPLATLFQAPTVAQLTEITFQETETGLSTDALVVLRSEGSRPPLFCVPGNLGNVFADLQYLIKYLPMDQPFYAFQDSIEVPTKIEDVASYYLEQLKQAQPEGPYWLTGICSGAVIAYEMAQQLQDENQPITLLALIEPSAPAESAVQTYMQLARSLVPRAMRRFTHHSTQMTDLTATEQKNYFRLKMKVFTNTWAVKHYRPQSYVGQLHLFLSDGSLASPNSYQQKWADFSTKGSTIHRITGTHDSITGNNDTPIDEADMKVLAEKLMICIDTILLD